MTGYESLYKYEMNEKRLVELLAKYESDSERVATEYRAAGEKFHTTEFWQEYLGL